jgi:phage terminase small subunit
MPILENSKHEKFAQEIAKGTPCSEAYVSAGYAKNDGNASRLKGNDRIRDRVQEILNEACAKVGVTVERVVAELAKIGFGDIRRAVFWGSGIAVPDGEGGTKIANGVGLLNSTEISDDAAAAISEVAQTKEGIRIKFHDKRAALVDLGRHLGMFTEKGELRVTISQEEALAALK